MLSDFHRKTLQGAYIWGMQDAIAGKPTGREYPMPEPVVTAVVTFSVNFMDYNDALLTTVIVQSNSAAHKLAFDKGLEDGASFVAALADGGVVLDPA